VRIRQRFITRELEFEPVTRQERHRHDLTRATGSNVPQSQNEVGVVLVDGRKNVRSPS
jgi:hypothetical protein